MAKKQTRGSRLKFPVPADYAERDSVIFCPSDRVKGLFNQDSGDQAARVADKVRKWFRQQAYSHGWGGVVFMPEVQTRHGAGCALWRKPSTINMNIVLTKNTLVLVDDEANDASDE